VRAADYLARFLDAQGVTHAFEVAGGMIAPLLDSIHRAGEPRLVSMHHEQAAAFAAEGFARASRIPAVAMATSGPGALNLLTGIGSCYFDSTPAVFITGQVNRAEHRGERPIRQLGFQETDIVAVAASLTKAAWRVDTPEALPKLLHDAFVLARSGRPGPVLVDIPIDIQGLDVAAPVPAGPVTFAPPPSADPDLALAALRRARRPLVLIGGGIRSSGSVPALRRMVAALGVPVVHSLMAVDVLPSDDPHRVGMIGTYGNRWANIALGRADCLLVLGSRLDIRQTGADVEAFARGRVIHHVDCDPGELGNRVRGCETHVAELSAFISAAAERSLADGRLSCADWLAEIAADRALWPDTDELRDIEGINPNALLHALGGPASAFVADVGQHQMWAAQSLELGAAQRFITSGGMGAMGSGLPLAIGAALAVPGAPVVLICGDGGLQLNIQELQTVVRNALALKIVVLNNRSHGMVRQFQESYFGGRYQSTRWGYSAPSFPAVARAYGLEAEAICDSGELGPALERLWSDADAPFLLEVAIDPAANAYPKLAFGRPITEMEPLAHPVPLAGGVEGT
jgi:acetolactate synthase I/II/III large subunit